MSMYTSNDDDHNVQYEAMYNIPHHMGPPHASVCTTRIQCIVECQSSKNYTPLLDNYTLHNNIIILYNISANILYCHSQWQIVVL